jgi:hypothetical protein
VFLFIQAANRSLRLGITCHLDETEPLTAAGVTVGNHFRLFDGAELRKQLFQIGASDVVAQISAIQLPSHRRSPLRGDDEPDLSLSGPKRKGLT